MDWRTEESWFDSWQEQDIFLSSRSVQTSFGPTQLPSVKWVPGVFPGLKWLGSESDHLIPTSIECWDVGGYTSTPCCAFMTSMWTPLPICWW